MGCCKDCENLKSVVFFHSCPKMNVEAAQCWLKTLEKTDEDEND